MVLFSTAFRAQCRATAEQFQLFQRYQQARHGEGDMATMSFYDYRAMVEDTPIETFIIEFRDPDDRMVSACLAALYNSPADALPHDFSAGIAPGAPRTDQRDSAPDARALLTFAPRAAAPPPEPDEVLAVLHQTLDSAAPTDDLASAEIIAAAFSEESTIIATSSSESRRTELFIVEKPVALSRPQTPFLTEVMDLEAIAASARESAAPTAGGSSADCRSENPDACEAAKEQVVAEMNAVAEEFVAEQRHHAPAASTIAANERPQDRRLVERPLSLGQRGLQRWRIRRSE